MTPLLQISPFEDPSLRKPGARAKSPISRQASPFLVSEDVLEHGTSHAKASARAIQIAHSPEHLSIQEMFLSTSEPAGVVEAAIGSAVAFTVGYGINNIIGLLRGNVPLAGFVQNAERTIPIHQIFNDIYGVDVAFWPEFYREVYNLDGEHFASTGIEGGYVGTPWVSTTYYKSRYTDIGRSETIIHMLNTGLRESRQLSPHFDLKFYWENYGDLRAAYGHIEDPKLRNEELLKHYIVHGCDEGRQASADSCVRSYLERYPQVAALVGPTAYKKGLIHLYKFGLGEGYSAAPWD